MKKLNQMRDKFMNGEPPSARQNTDNINLKSSESHAHKVKFEQEDSAMHTSLSSLNQHANVASAGALSQ